MKFMNVSAENGIQVLLSGFGGDEGVSYNGSGFFEEMAHAGMGYIT